MYKILILGFGGIIGTLARYFLAGSVHRAAGVNFPYGTLAVNIAGCFLIGLLASLSENKFLLSPDLKLLLMIGFCGAFTTFSTFIFETDSLIRDGQMLRAFINVFASIVIGFLVYRIGVFIGESL